MSLDIELLDNSVSVLNLNITNNLNKMVQQYSYEHYLAIWHPYDLNSLDKCRPLLAIDVVNYYEETLIEFLHNRKEYERYNSSNGWGTYDDMVSFLTQLISYCHKYPTATLTACT